jgi:hypothetical protein
MNIIKLFFEEYKGARRFSLFWAITLITYVVVNVIQPENLSNINAASATVVTSILGILATVIGFYQWHRSQDDS